MEKQCSEEGNDKIRCIDCSCNFIVDCEPKKIN